MEGLFAMEKVQPDHLGGDVNAPNRLVLNWSL